MAPLLWGALALLVLDTPAPRQVASGQGQAPPGGLTGAGLAAATQPPPAGPLDVIKAGIDLFGKIYGVLAPPPKPTTQTPPFNPQPQYTA